MQHSTDPLVRDSIHDAYRALSNSAYQEAHAHCMRVLERAPLTPEPYFILALIGAAHGNFSKALDVVDRALRLDSGNPAYHAHRAKFLTALHRHAEAVQTAERAVASSPQDALTWDTIGVVFTRAGLHEQAVSAYRRAVEVDQRAGSKQASYWYNLGAALQFVGELEGAASALRRVLEIEPAHERAWSGLAKLGLTAEEVARLETLASRPAASVDAELHLCHALASHYESIGRYRDAFALWERGKARKRETLGYSFESDRVIFEAARLTAQPSAGEGYPSRAPIFVVGMPRTGTTLIERILSSHPEVLTLGERDELSLCIKKLTGTRTRHVLDAETLRAAAAMDVTSAGEDYIDSLRYVTGQAQRFVDKLPLNFLYAGLIRRALPQARIVCLRRNPIDTCLSNYRQLFSTNFPHYDYSYDLLDTARYYVEFDRLARHWRETLGDRYMEIEYEDVVENPERAARTLLAFCELEWHPACLEFHRNRAPVATASSAQVRQPLYRGAMGRWRHYERELEPLIALLHEHGIALESPVR